MLKVMGKNKKYLFGMITVGLFGIAGFYYGFVLIAIYGFLFEGERGTGFVILCIGAMLAVSSCINDNGR